MSEAKLNLSDKQLLVLLPEKVDITNSHDILKEISVKMQEEHVDKVIFDLSKCEFISSAGIGLLANIIRQTKDKKMKTNVINYNSSIKEVLTITDIMGYIDKD